MILFYLIDVGRGHLFVSRGLGGTIINDGATHSFVWRDSAEDFNLKFVLPH